MSRPMTPQVAHELGLLLLNDVEAVSYYSSKGEPYRSLHSWVASHTSRDLRHGDARFMLVVPSDFHPVISGGRIEVGRDWLVEQLRLYTEGEP